MAEIFSMIFAAPSTRRYRKISMRSWRTTEVFKIRSFFDFEAYTLHRSLRRQEAEVCKLVDECQAVLRQRIQEFFRSKRKQADQLAEDLMAGRKTASSVSLATSILPQGTLATLMDEIKSLMENEVSRFFGVRPLIYFSVPDIEKAWQVIARLSADYQASLGVMRLAAAVSKKAAEKSVENLNLPWAADKIIGELDFSAVFLRYVNCHPQEQYPRYRQELSGQISEMLQAMEEQLAADACANLAKSCYELYDLVAELQYEQALVRLRARRRANDIGHESTCLSNAQATA